MTFESVTDANRRGREERELCLGSALHATHRRIQQTTAEGPVPPFTNQGPSGPGLSCPTDAATLIDTQRPDCAHGKQNAHLSLALVQPRSPCQGDRGLSRVGHVEAVKLRPRGQGGQQTSIDREGEEM